MIVGIIRIILPGVILRDNGVCSQVKEQTGILPDDPCDHLVQLVIRYDLSDHKENTDMETAAPDPAIFLGRKSFPWEEFQKLLIWEHEIRLFVIPFPNASPFRYAVLLLL